MFLYLKLFRESVLFAFQALVANKLRTFLSLLGVTFGIFVIIAVFTMVDTLENGIRDGVDSLGDNVVYVQRRPWAPEDGEYKWWIYERRPQIRDYEAERLAEKITKAEGCVFLGFSSATVESGSHSATNVTLQVVGHDFPKVRQFDLSEGRYFTRSESRTGRNFVIIGANVRDALFGSRAAVGKEIKVKGRKLKVIGVFEKEGESIMTSTMDNSIVVPVKFGESIVKVRQMESMIIVKAKQGVEVEELISEMRGAMRGIRRIRPTQDDNFALNEASVLSSNMDSLFSIINKVGGAIGVLCILVGGFNIANIMFVSVKERTSLIGIQKSLGAKNAFILGQFLVESVVLCLIGGLVGLVLVFLGAKVAAVAFDFSIGLSIANIVWGLGISAVIGLISGILPALAASRLDPVEAIRAN